MLAASFFILAAFAGYALLCMARPFAVCRKCSGTGLRNRTGRNLKPCRRCRGHRTRLRAGRRLHNHAHRLHADGTRPDRTAKESLPWQ
ncbi:hypothetical protein [Streptomyces sp. NPDC059080]|uniref:hypothetical protein n=1 Tax=Streptomyces sp. NPDC059080 TaxID=3346718 RepID=UPI0036C0D55A